MEFIVCTDGDYTETTINKNGWEAVEKDFRRVEIYVVSLKETRSEKKKKKQTKRIILLGTIIIIIIIIETSIGRWKKKKRKDRTTTLLSVPDH